MDLNGCASLNFYIGGLTFPELIPTTCPVYSGYPSTNGLKYPARQNLALGRPTYYSSLFGWNSVGCYAVDGNCDSDIQKNSCFCSADNDGGPNWFIVDLQNIYHISHVNITNRMDLSFSDRESMLYVGLLKSYTTGMPMVRGTYPLCNQYPNSSLNIAQLDVSCDYEHIGRYVIVQIILSQIYLQVCEIQVFGYLCKNVDNIPYNNLTYPDNLTFTCRPASGFPNNLMHPVPVNLALGRPVYVSSLLNDGVSESCNIVDGNADGVYADLSCASTLAVNGTVQWMMVDLQANYVITRVVISNRYGTAYTNSKDVDCSLGNVMIRLLSNYSVGNSVNATTGWLCGSNPATSSQFVGKVKVICSAKISAARYIFIMQNDFLTFCELEVYHL